MKTAIWLLVLLTLVNRIKARSKVSLTDLITCQEYSIKSGTGYGYHDYFDVNKLNVADASHGDELLRLEFFVQAAKEAHIILAKSITPKPTGYEIVIGAGKNTYSYMYNKTDSKRLIKNSLGNTVSASDPTQIEIILTRGKSPEFKLTVNLVGLDEPHMERTVSHPVEINYVSFSSYGDTSATWYYDCKTVLRRPSKESDDEKKLPDELRLIKDLSNRKMQPPDLKNIALNFVEKEVTYDTETETMHSRGDLFMTLIDSRLQWNPSDYGNLTFFKSYKFWTPKLRVVGVKASLKAIPGHFQSTIYHNGTVTAQNPDVQIDALCPDPKKDWPHSRSISCSTVFLLDNWDASLVYDTQSKVE